MDYCPPLPRAWLFLFVLFPLRIHQPLAIALVPLGVSMDDKTFDFSIDQSLSVLYIKKVPHMVFTPRQFWLSCQRRGKHLPPQQTVHWGVSAPPCLPFPLLRCWSDLKVFRKLISPAFDFLSIVFLLQTPSGPKSCHICF